MTPDARVWHLVLRARVERDLALYQADTELLFMRFRHWCSKLKINDPAAIFEPGSSGIFVGQCQSFAGAGSRNREISTADEK